MSTQDDEARPRIDPNATKTASGNDLVIRNGFPALLLPDGSPNIQDDEPIPKHSFWVTGTSSSIIAAARADGGAVQAALLPVLPNVVQLRSDADAVFTARTRDDGAAYSAGVTYFLPCQMVPRCALEGLVQSIFQAHTEELKSTFHEETSGAEWWTLVMDDSDDAETGPVSDGDTTKKPSYATAAGDVSSPDKNKAKQQTSANDKDPAEYDDNDQEDDDDEVGMHFDADYGLEAQAPGLLLHPRLATITYLSDFGAPTVVWDRKSSPPDCLDELTGPVGRAWLSHPKIGKHIAFDGRLLHGAPTVFFPAATAAAVAPAAADFNDEKDDSSRPTKRIKQDRRRITLLVNIWLNHCPLDAEPLDEESLAQLTTPWGDATNLASYSWTPSADCLNQAPEKMVVVKLGPASRAEDEAGSEEFVVCERLVTAVYRSTMDDLHAASNAGDLVEVLFENGAFSLSVGDKVEQDEDEVEKALSDT
jgi:hypothetical protein